MKKFYLFTLLVAVIALLPGNRIAAQQPSVWDGDTISTKWFTDKPNAKAFTIATAADLAGLAKLVNEGKNFLGCTVTLTSDIDLNNKPWTPIGSSSAKCFQGYFDGKTNRISNLLIDQSASKEDNNYTGFFGYIAINATADKFGLANITLEKGQVIGGGSSSSVGALVGAIHNNNNKPYMVDSCRNESVNVVAAASAYNMAGGIAGDVSGAIDISLCFNNGEIKSESTKTVVLGGIVANIYSSGKVTLSASGNKGNLVATQTNDAILGGIAGELTVATAALTVKNVYSNAIIRSNQGTVGGLIGKVAASATQSFLLTNSWLTSTEINGKVVGGVVGTISKANKTTTTISNVISFPRLLRGDDATTHRIYGYSDDAITLSHNYASYGRYKDGEEGVNEKGIEGANWTGKNADQPLSSWNKETDKPWEFCPTQVFLPLLKEVDEDFHTRNVEAFRVQFDTRGGSELADVAVFGKDSIDRPTDPILPGYAVQGWYKDPELTEEWRFNVNIVTKDLTLYVKWKQTHYLVRFETNGGSKIDSTLYLVDKPIMTPPTPPTRATYKFMGWYADAALKTAWVFGKDGTKLTKETTLYAKWYKDGPLVTFDSKGGSAVDPIDSWKGMAIDKPADPTRTGYYFFGWYADEAYTLPWYFGETGTPVVQDITLYAKWLYDVNRKEITIEAIPAQLYTGKAICPKVNVRQADTLLIESKDYLVDYKNNIEVGKATATIVGINGYANVRSVDFTIENAKVYHTLTIPEVEGATTLPAAGSHEIEEGEEVSLKITLEEGFSFKYTEVFVNEQQVFPDPLKSYEVTVDDSTITIDLGAMTEDITITVSGVSPVSIGETSALFDLIARDGSLEINAQQAATMTVFRLNGAIVKQQTVGVGTTIVPLSAGVYFVQINDNSWKVIVR